MTGVDTNIIIRLLTQDDPEQASRAKNVFADKQIFIADTVLLETEWVLRFAYGFAPKAIYQAIMNLLGLPNVHVARPDMLYQALQIYKAGLDFADAMHLAANSNCPALLTFDKAFIRRAKGLTDCRVMEP